MVATQRLSLLRSTFLAPLVCGVALAVACDAPSDNSMAGSPAAGGKADDTNADSGLIDNAIERFAKLTHPLVQIACRGRANGHRIHCQSGVDDDDNEDGIRDGGTWPTTVWDADGVRRVENGDRYSSEMCDCQYQRSVNSCEELDVELLADIYREIYKYYTTEFPVQLLEDLVDSDKEQEQTEDDLLDFDPFDDWEDEEEPEVPFDGDKRIDLLGVLAVAADFAIDEEFTEPADVCECVSNYKPGSDAGWRCGEQLPFCQIGVCTQCERDSHCGTQQDGRASVCELGTCIAAP